MNKTTKKLKLPKKEVSNYESLLAKKETVLTIYEGKNSLSTLNEDTKIVIVGSFLPQRLIYFYNDNSYMYEAIDASRKTNLRQYKKNYPANFNANEKQKIINGIQSILLEQKIAFADLSKYALVETGKCSDDDIKAFVVDYDMLNKIKSINNIVVVSVTEDVEAILLKNGIDNYYVKLFPGQSTRYPKGTDYHALWRDVFDFKIKRV